MAGDTICCSDNVEYMSRLPDGSCDLIYADPPFFSGKTHRQASGRGAVRDHWQGGFEEYLAFLRPRLEQMRRLLRPSGSIFVHLDWHAVAYVKVMMDELFGYDNFLNEIIWSYRTGGRSDRWFARKHDTILSYARKLGDHKFNIQREGSFRTDGMNYDEAGRPYKQTKSGRLYFHPDGPAMTDVWEIPFLSTVSRERVGYPTQKPEALLKRIIESVTDPGDCVGDFFCGSGTTPVVAERMRRTWLACDMCPEAVAVAAARLKRQRDQGSESLFNLA